ncbi:MAG: PKD domain-containing protein [Opitutales bacterium]|nr:PKD domain-containing protein [Opitutales bacterium]
MIPYLILRFPRSLHLSVFAFAASLACAALAFGEDSPWNLSAASYLGYAGNDDEVYGLRVLADGTIVLAAQIGDAQPRNPGAPAPVEPTLLNGATATSSGAIVRLSSDGRTILSVTRVSDELRDLEIDNDDNLYVAAGFAGLLKLNSAADTLLGVRQAGSFVKRVTASASYVATLVPDNLAAPQTTPGGGDITLYDTALNEIAAFRGFRHTLDLAIHEPSETVALVGWRQANSWQNDGAGVLPVQIAYLRGVDFSGSVKWDAYDWDTHSNIDGGNEFASEDITVGDTVIPQGFVVTTNPRFLNSTGQVIGHLPEPDGRAVYGFENNMADTRGYRLTVGEDGYLYAGYEAAGGNHVFRRRGLRDSDLPDFRENTPQAGGDLFNSFINTGAGHKTVINRYDAATGEKIRGNLFNTLISISSGPSANTLRMTQGGLHVDAEGRLYFGAAAASGLPLPGNALFSQGSQTSLQPFGLGTNEGGAYLWVVDSNMSTRLFVGRISSGSTRAVHARVPTGTTQPLVAWAGRAALSRPMFVRNAVQPQPGYGTDDGFFAVLGGPPAVDGGGRFDFEYGGDYTASNTTLRGTNPTQFAVTVEGTDGRITEYPYREDIPLSPPAPNYSGPPFFGGFRATYKDRTGTTNFSTNQYSGSNTNIRVQPGGSTTARQQGVFFFDHTAFGNIGPEDVLTFDSESFLTINGSGLSGGRWLVRDGETFYVSEASFGGTANFVFTSAEDNGNWAVFDPDDSLDFDLSGVTYEPHVFNNVTAVGFIINQPDFSGSRFWMQWNGFTANLAVNAEGNQTPVAIIDASPAGNLVAPATVTLDSAASFDPDGDITFIRWDTGDNTNIAGPVYSHEYQTAGRYSALLTVWDDNLVVATANSTVNIAAPAADRPERTIASWGGNPVNSNTNFRDGGNVQHVVDLSGDGTNDARRRGTPFREDSPVVGGRGTTLYGGIWNTSLSEGGTESNSWAEGGIGNSGVNDRFTIRLQPNSTRPVSLHGAIFLNKEHFLGAAASESVSLAAGDRFIMSNIDLFERMSPLRWLVRDGDQFYVSEATITPGTSAFTVPADNDHGQWAPFDPADEADSLNFDADAAAFSSRVFSDITALGFVIDNDTFEDGRIRFRFRELIFEGTVDAPTPVTSGFDQWLLDNFTAAERADPAVVHPLAAPDGDDIVNFVKYALRLPRQLPDRSGLPQAEMLDGRLGLEFFLDPDLTDVAYVVEVSNTLEADQWTPLFDSRTDPLPLTEAGWVRVEDPALVDPDEPRRFLRLRVELLD